MRSARTSTQKTTSTGRGPETDLIINIIEDNDEPEYFSPALPTHRVKVEPWGLYGLNDNGGGDSDINPNPAVVTIVRHWWDYETGWGFEAEWNGRTVWFREHQIQIVL